MTDKKKPEERRKHQNLWLVEDQPAKGPNGEARTMWTKIGVAFENRDGSWSLHLSAIPVSGRLQMRPPHDLGEMKLPKGEPQ